MKKQVLIFMIIACILVSSVLFASCGVIKAPTGTTAPTETGSTDEVPNESIDDSTDDSTGESITELQEKQQALYAQYIAYTEAIGETPMSYAEWLESIKGEDGIDGLTPFIGTNGNWWIGDTDTGVKAKGEDGADGVDGVDGVEWR